MVVLGYPDTTQVTMEEMLHHTRAVARGAKKTWVTADMPSASYADFKTAKENATRLIDAGADAVKLEGGTECLEAVEAILGASIPMIGHLGMLPQRVREEGGYRIKGKDHETADALLESALRLEGAGVSAIVLELVHPPVAKQISETLRIPTIGIGSGPDCDGQILVFHDLVGLFPWFRPKFAKPMADVATQIQEAVRGFTAECRNR